MDDIAADVAPRRRQGRRRRPPRHPRHHRPLAAPPPALGRSTTRHPSVRAIVVRGQHVGAHPEPAAGRYSAAIIHLPVDDPELVDRAAVRRGPRAASRTRDHPLGRPRARCPSPSWPTHRLLLPPAGSALRRVLDRAARSVGVQLAGPGRDRRRAPAGHARRRRPRRHDRPGHRRSPFSTEPLGRSCASPSCRRVSSRSPTSAARHPAPPARALFDVLRDVLADPAPPTSPASGWAPRRSRSPGAS